MIPDIKQIEEDKYEWVCPCCSKIQIVDSMVANVIYHSRFETRYVCDDCKRKFGPA